MIDIRNTPPPFPQGEPRFVEALRRKPEFHTYWDMSLEPQEDEADFRKGIDFHAESPVTHPTPHMFRKTRTEHQDVITMTQLHPSGWQFHRYAKFHLFSFYRSAKTVS